MTVFRLTDATDTSRESRDYWDTRVREGWESAFHAVTSESDDDQHLDVLRWLIGPDDRVLEGACGYGRLAGRVAAFCRQYVGVDFVEQSIQEARRTAPRNATFHVGDIGEWQGGLFDVIFLVGAWSSIESRSAEVVEHLRGQLAPGGQLVFFEAGLYLMLT